MWISPLRLNDAEEPARGILEGIRAKRGAVPKLLLTMARRPEVLNGRQTMNMAVHGGNSTLGQRREELISYYVATIGGCYG